MRFFSKHKFMFSCFTMIIIFQLAGNGDRIPIHYDNLCYTFHIVDFSLGFISKVLPGQIFMWIFKNPTVELYKAYSIALLAILCLIISYFLEKIYLCAPKEYKSTYAYVIVLFCASGFVFNMFFCAIGIIDVYWIVAVVAFFLSLQSKKTWFLIPVCFLFLVFVHYGAMLCYIPLLSIILLYEASNLEGKDKKTILAILAISIVLSVGFVLVFLYNESHMDDWTKEKLHSFIESRGGTVYIFYDYVVLKEMDLTKWGVDILIKQSELFNFSFLPNFLNGFLNRFAYQLYLNYQMTLAFVQKLVDNILWIYASIVLVGIPYVYFYYKCCRQLYKRCENKLKKFSLFCALALFIIAFFSLTILSMDKVRYSHHSIICIFVFFLYIMFREKDTFAEIVSSNMKKINLIHLLLFLVTAFLLRCYPYID